MKISAHFDRSEFACKCGCGFDTVDKVLCDLLELIRAEFACPIIVTSGCRCAEHNKKEGGSDNSQHVKGKAADIKISRADPSFVYGWLCEKFPDRFGFGLYGNRIHVDVREEKARW